VPDKYYKQTQGQLMASGRNWCDFVAGNLNTQSLKVIRVERDETMIKETTDSLPAVDDIVVKFDETGIYKFNSDIIDVETSVDMDIWEN